MAKLLMRVEGMDGQIELTEDRVIIFRRGFWNIFKYGFNSQREIPYTAISEVAFKNATVLGMGSIEFVRSGRSSDEKKNSDLNTVKFSRKRQEEFVAVKEKIFQIIDYLARQRA